MILLLSPHPDDRALVAFAAYLRARAVAHEFCSDLTALRFGVTLDRDGRTRIRLRLPDAGDVSASELGVVVRSPWAWQATGPSRQDRFVATEYHSSVWTICALLPRVVNRPGRWAWLHERELRYLLPRSAFLAEYWTTDVHDLAERWRADGSAQAHVEDLLTEQRWVLDAAEALPARAQLRTLFAPGSRYLIQICVGTSAVTVLNEPGSDVESADHRAFLAGVAERLATHGVYFYALALLVMPDGPVRLARVVTEPPWSWYAGHADEVHDRLYAFLEATG